MAKTLYWKSLFEKKKKKKKKKWNDFVKVHMIKKGWLSAFGSYKFKRTKYDSTN